MMKNKRSLVRTIYLYLFALVGLALVTVGAVRLVNLGLKTYVFTEADQDYYATPQPRVTPNTGVEIETLIESCKNNEELNEEQKAFLIAWQEDYQNWKEKQGSNVRLRSQRQEETAASLAWLIVGLPLFLYYWNIIRKETEINSEA